ncbi:ABC-type multidrug transport system fused ATPase/permease subunit [Kribbella aluminosa]|uniref:ABC-type multidrug transport system fused ATPase/permease subunit n=1 Tax=Kribbella aluminosa TaxID=416017 RepID=A0ABS4UPZ2_9ACTN|nr:type IV secretion system protein [Kribbella aluminosa]MBP2353716.1 ABC-type multidrug transport system fused ATPase/permease subunit [Kribbella aluminosa]
MIALGCSWWPSDWKDCVTEGLKTAVEWAFGKFFDFIFQAIAKVVVAAVEAVMQAVGLLWIKIGTPDIAANTPALWIQGHTKFIMVFVASLAVIYGAMQMAFSHRGEPARDILRSLLTLVVVSVSATTFAGTLIAYADDFSSNIIDASLHAHHDNFAGKLAETMTNPLKSPAEQFGWLLVIFVGILMVITSIIQLGLMLVRYAMLILLVGVLPITAAATNTEMGMAWFKKAVSWLVAFIIYKPVAALIYATAFYLMGAPDVPNAGPGTSQTLKIIMGITMMIVAVVALPALLRFVSPKAS